DTSELSRARECNRECSRLRSRGERRSYRDNRSPDANLGDTNPHAPSHTELFPIRPCRATLSLAPARGGSACCNQQAKSTSFFRSDLIALEFHPTYATAASQRIHQYHDGRSEAHGECASVWASPPRRNLDSPRERSPDPKNLRYPILSRTL